MKKFFVFFCLALTTSVGAQTYCVAHRGHHNELLENSVAALQSAIKIGSDGVEFDIHHTKDGIPVIMHDDDLSRTAQSRPGENCPSKKISKLTLKEIQTKCMLNNGEDIPTLKSFLAILKVTSIFIFIEFKDFPQYYTLSLINQELGPSAERVRFISFKEKYLNQAFSFSNEFNHFNQMKGLLVYRFFHKPKSDYGLDTRFSFGRAKRMMKYKNFETGVWPLDEGEGMIWADFMMIKFITTNNPELCLRLVHH